VGVDCICFNVLMTGPKNMSNQKGSGAAEWKSLLQVSFIFSVCPTNKFTTNALEIYELVKQLPSHDLPVLHKVLAKDCRTLILDHD
jgi:hypothetical protein